MICPKCKLEIENDSKFCPICGEKIDEFVEDNVLEEKETVAEATSEVKEEKPSRKKVPLRTKKLYSCIFSLIISIIVFVMPFANISGYNVFKSSNIITFFINCNYADLLSNYGKNLGSSYFAIGIIGYVLTIIVMFLCLVNLVLSIISLILNFNSKFINIINATIFAISLLNALLFAFNGSASVLAIILILIYGIGRFVIDVIDLEYKNSVKTVYCVGFGSLIISFISLMIVSASHSTSGLLDYLYNIKNALITTDYFIYRLLDGYISQLIFFIMLILTTVFCLTSMLFFKKKMIVPISGFIVFFIGIIFTIMLNLTSTYIIQVFVSPSVMFLLSSILLFVVDLIVIKKEREIKRN